MPPVATLSDHFRSPRVLFGLLLGLVRLCSLFVRVSWFVSFFPLDPFGSFCVGFSSFFLRQALSALRSSYGPFGSFCVGFSSFFLLQAWVCLRVFLFLVLSFRFCVGSSSDFFLQALSILRFLDRFFVSLWVQFALRFGHSSFSAYCDFLSRCFRLGSLSCSFPGFSRCLSLSRLSCFLGDFATFRRFPRPFIPSVLFTSSCGIRSFTQKPGGVSRFPRLFSDR